MTGMIVTDYSIEVANTHLILGNFVRARMADGFQPFGSLMVVHTQKKEDGVLVPTLLFAQALVKYTALG